MTRVRKGNTAGASKDRGAGRSIDETARDHLRELLDDKWAAGQDSVAGAAA